MKVLRRLKPSFFLVTSAPMQPGTSSLWHGVYPDQLYPVCYCVFRTVWGFVSWREHPNNWQRSTIQTCFLLVYCHTTRRRSRAWPSYIDSKRRLGNEEVYPVQCVALSDRNGVGVVANIFTEGFNSGWVSDWTTAWGGAEYDTQLLDERLFAGKPENVLSAAKPRIKG